MVQIFGGDAEIDGQIELFGGLVKGADVGNALFVVGADEKQAVVVFVVFGQAVKVEAGDGDEFFGVFGSFADVVGVKKHEFVKIADFVEFVF